MSDLEISQIRMDGGTQPRAQLNWLVIDEYAESMKSGVKFAPVTVFYDGKEHWLADGFHRVNAALQAEKETITADVHQGTRRDAVLWSVGANADHGLRRTNEDKRRAVMSLLNDSEWVQWSDNEIARRCKVSQPFVSKIRASLITVISEDLEERTYTTKHGTVATMNTAKIGAAPAAQIPLNVRSMVRNMSIADNPTELATLAKLEAEIQEQVIELISVGDAEKVRDAVSVIKRQERIEKINAISEGNAEIAETLGRFPFVYADPPWRYEHVKTNNRAIENHYPTMDLDEICALSVHEITTDDCVLFLWATSPKLEESMQVINSWGFTYRTCMVWDKEKIGMGYYARQQHELLLIATKGSPPVPTPESRPPSVVRCARGEHSAKPEIFYELIERMYPDFRKVELFARNRRDGWQVWGNQS